MRRRVPERPRRAEGVGGVPGVPGGPSADAGDPSAPSAAGAAYAESAGAASYAGAASAGAGGTYGATFASCFGFTVAASVRVASGPDGARSAPFAIFVPAAAGTMNVAVASPRENDAVGGRSVGVGRAL